MYLSTSVYGAAAAAGLGFAWLCLPDALAEPVFLPDADFLIDFEADFEADLLCIGVDLADC